MFYQNHRPYLPINTPKPPSKKSNPGGSREHPKRSQRKASRDTFELDTRERRHRRPHRPSAPLQVGGQQGMDPLPEISSPWSTTLHGVKSLFVHGVVRRSWVVIAESFMRLIYHDSCWWCFDQLSCLLRLHHGFGFALLLHGLLRLHQLSCSCWFVTDYPRVVTVCGREMF